jgi:hypothetical protein
VFSIVKEGQGGVRDSFIATFNSRELVHEKLFFVRMIVLISGCEV